MSKEELSLAGVRQHLLDYHHDQLVERYGEQAVAEGFTEYPSIALLKLHSELDQTPVRKADPS